MRSAHCQSRSTSALSEQLLGSSCSSGGERAKPGEHRRSAVTTEGCLDGECMQLPLTHFYPLLLLFLLLSSSYLSLPVPIQSHKGLVLHAQRPQLQLIDVSALCLVLLLLLLHHLLLSLSLLFSSFVGHCFPFTTASIMRSEFVFGSSSLMLRSVSSTLTEICG